MSETNVWLIVWSVLGNWAGESGRAGILQDVLICLRSFTQESGRQQRVWNNKWFYERTIHPIHYTPYPNKSGKQPGSVKHVATYSSEVSVTKKHKQISFNSWPTKSPSCHESWSPASWPIHYYCVFIRIIKWRKNFIYNVPLWARTKNNSITSRNKMRLNIIYKEIN